MKLSTTSVWINYGRFSGAWGDKKKTKTHSCVYQMLSNTSTGDKGPSSLSSQRCDVILVVLVILEGEYEPLVRSYRLLWTCHLILRWIGWGASTDLSSPKSPLESQLSLQAHLQKLSYSWVSSNKTASYTYSWGVSDIVHARHESTQILFNIKNSVKHKSHQVMTLLWGWMRDWRQ